MRAPPARPRRRAPQRCPATGRGRLPTRRRARARAGRGRGGDGRSEGRRGPTAACRDRKSTRLNSSHTVISYAVFCLKKKKKKSKKDIKTVKTQTERSNRT